MARRRSQFRPCIDLHEGQVKQIVGGSLTDDGAIENFVAAKPSSSFAKQFRDDSLVGGHVIKLGPGNDTAAIDAISAWPGGLQIGGGITIENANKWIEAGASHVIVTSWLFNQESSPPAFDVQRLQQLTDLVSPQRIVIDLSCRRKSSTSGSNSQWLVTMNRWQTETDLPVTLEVLDRLAIYCDEFLIHAADVEGKCGGFDRELVALLSQHRQRRVTYAGGVSTMEEFKAIDEISNGEIDVTVGSALDLFGGTGLKYAELVQWNQAGNG